MSPANQIASKTDPFHAAGTLDTALRERTVYRLDALKSIPGHRLDSMPYSIKVMLEACLRHFDGFIVTQDAIKALACYNARQIGQTEIPFMPGRVVLQDFTGVPCVVD